jgi:hypothetical protein
LPRDPAFARSDFEKSTLQPDLDVEAGDAVLDDTTP